MRKALIHLSPEEKLARSSEGAVSAIQQNTKEISKVLTAIEELHQTTKDDDKSVEIEGFSKIEKAGQETTDAVVGLHKTIENAPKEVVRKLEDVQKMQEIGNRYLAELNKKEYPEPKDDTELRKLLEAIRDKETDDTEELSLLTQIEANTRKEPVIKVDAPIVNVKAPEVHVDAPVLNVDTTKLERSSEAILETLGASKTESTTLLDKIEKALRTLIRVTDLGDKGMSVGGGGLGSIDSGYLANIGKNYAVRMDDVSTTSVTYVGKALMGSSSTSPVWQIMKVDESNISEPLIELWANGNDGFINKWSERTTITYS